MAKKLITLLPLLRELHARGRLRLTLVNVQRADADELSKRDIDSIRVVMYRTRRHKYGCLPVNMLETVNILKDMPISTSRREDMLCYINELTINKPFVMFTTRTNLNALCAPETVLMDSRPTFKS